MFVWLGIIYLFQGTVQAVLPAGWKLCPKDVPDRNECIKNAMSEAVLSLVNGNKKLGVLPIDPLEFESIHTKGDMNGPVALDVVFNKFVLYNLKNLQISSTELDGNTLKVKAHLPGTLEARSSYKVSGKILMLPITGDGMSNFTFWNGNLTFDITFRPELETRKDKQYWVVEKLVHHSFPQKIDMYLENLFNGNKALGDTMNKVLNENWELVWTELKPLIEEAISEAFKQLSNRVFSKIPANEINLF